jgi:small subunit ribosomal protein S1
MLNNSDEICPIVSIDPILLEESTRLDEKQMAELSSIYEEVARKFRSGTLITGQILHKEGGGVTVSIGYKSDGFIPHYEFTEFELEKLSENDEIEVLLDHLEDSDGNVVLSYQKAKSLKAWSKISKLAEDDEPIVGLVTHKVKGGLSVDVGIPAFLPGSQIDLHRVNDFDHFIGQEVTCKVLKINRRRGNVIVSRRKYMEELRQEDKSKALDTIEENQVLPGVVKNITNYGAFVDIGGIDGLLHITDMSWGRIGHPSELVKMGDELTVKVLSFDKDNEKISLGIKQLQDNPWDNVEKLYPLNSKTKGSISSITDYGLFIEVQPGIEGLVHISEVSWTERVHNLNKRYQVGQEIDVLVAALDRNNRRMSLSIKRLDEDPWKVALDKFSPGDKVSGSVSNVADFGIFVRIHSGVDGLVHVSDISWTEHIAHPADKFKKGDEVDVTILSIDKENRRISLGIKQLDRDPWETIENDFPVGQMVKGTISKVTSFGAFVKFASGIEGLAHISEISDKDSENSESALKVGMEAEFRVVKSSKDDRKLGLSLKDESAASESAPSPAPKFKKRAAAASQSNDKRSHKKERGSSNDSLPKKASTSSSSSMKGSLQQALEKMKSDADSEGDK